MIDHINTTRDAHVITIEDPIEYLHRDNAVHHQPARNRRRHAVVRLCAAQRAPPGPGRHPGRRNARHGNDRDGDARRRDRPPGVLDAAHPRRDGNHQPHHLGVPAAPAETDPPAAGVGAEGRGGAAPDPAQDGTGRAPGVEVLVATPFIKDCIVDKDKTHLIAGAIAQGTSQYGMQTFDQSIFSLFSQDIDQLRRGAALGVERRRIQAQGAGHLDHRGPVARPDGRTRSSASPAAGRRRQLPNARDHALRSKIAQPVPDAYTAALVDALASGSFGGRSVRTTAHPPRAAMPTTSPRPGAPQARIAPSTTAGWRCAAARLESAIRHRGPATGSSRRLQSRPASADDVVQKAVTEVFEEVDENALLDARLRAAAAGPGAGGTRRQGPRPAGARTGRPGLLASKPMLRKAQEVAPPPTTIREMHPRRKFARPS